jgi:protein SCO1
MIRLADIFTFGVQALACRCTNSLKAVLRTRRVAASILLASGFWLLAPSPALAQYRPDITPDAGPSHIPNPGITEKTSAKLPLDLTFTNSEGQTAPLANYFSHERPVILSLVYFSCPSICGFNQDSLVAAVRQGPRGLKLGQDYDILVVSIDPDDTPRLAAAKRKNYLAKVPLPESQSGFTYLTGTEANIQTLADSVGFAFRRNFTGDKFLHSTGIFICTPDGRLSQTILGIDYQPDQLHNALRIASNGKVGSGLLSFALACGAMKYNPKTGQYDQNPWFYAGTAGGIISILFMATLLSILWRGEAKRNKNSAPPTAPTT